MASHPVSADRVQPPQAAQGAVQDAQLVQQPPVLPPLPAQDDIVHNEQPIPAAPSVGEAVTEEPQDQLTNAQLTVTVQSLKEEVKNLKSSTSVSVETSLANVRQLVSAPVRLRDPHLMLLAIQKLADDARTSNHSRAAEFEAILRQVRPYAYSPRFGDIVTRLIGSKEETKVAAQIAKITKASPSSFQPSPSFPRPLWGRGRGRGRARCFSCGQLGHFQ